MKINRIDEKDRKILCALQKDGRVPNAHLAEKVGLSPPSVLERVRKLETRGLIRGYTAILDEKKLGFGATVFVQVSLALHKSEAIENFHKTILDLPEIHETYHVTGEEDYLLKVVLPNIESYEDFLLHKLTCIEGIDRVKSSFVLSSLKKHSYLKLLEEDC